MIKSLKISVITPFFNCAPYIGDMVESVLKQSFSSWELLLINDGSTDDSGSIARGYSDDRIRYFEQPKKGVASARNVGLSVMTGDYFCFLDADDVWPADSLRTRILKFHSYPELSFVDGRVDVMDPLLSKVTRSWHPTLEGNPLEDLVCLGGQSFFGGTWMVKRVPHKVYLMMPDLTHSEDLLFYIGLACEGGSYGFVNDLTLIYRQGQASAMKDLRGLEYGYRVVYDKVRQLKEVDARWLDKYRSRTRRIMIRSYLRRGNLRDAWNVAASWLH